MEIRELKLPLNKYIDHTLVKPDATDEQFESFLDEAVKYEFASVCVSPRIVSGVVSAMKPYPNIKVGTVVSFPFGNVPTAFKLGEISYLIEKGVQEIDFVLNYGELKSLRHDIVINELKQIGNLCQRGGIVSKCIVETCYLSNNEKQLIFKYIQDHSSIDFIKTSTGYGSDSAQIADVRMWNTMRGSNVKPLIKAAGGIRDLDTALSFIEAGADRLGMSTSVKVMESYNAQKTFIEGEETT